MSERDATNFFITMLMAINRCSLQLELSAFTMLLTDLKTAGGKLGATATNSWQYTRVVVVVVVVVFFVVCVPRDLLMN